MLDLRPICHRCFQCRSRAGRSTGRPIYTLFDGETKNRLRGDAPQTALWRLHFNALTRVEGGRPSKSQGEAEVDRWPSSPATPKVVSFADREASIRKASPRRRVKISLALRPALQSVPMWSAPQDGSEEFHDFPVFAYTGFDEDLPPLSIRP